MAYGNTSVSSLLRAARAAQQKQYSLEDSIAAYEYDLSPKTQEAFNKYSAHLQNRIKQHQGTDPLKALNYQKTITSANRSFTSSELSRATTQVLYGNMDNGAKLNTMMNLYQRAIENGDENLAQRIEGQAAMLQNTMARSFGGGGYGRGSGSVDDPELRGIKDSTANFKRHEKLLQEEYRRGNISLRELQAGYTDKATGQHIPGLRQTYESINSLKAQLEGGPMTPEREAAYTGLLDTLRSDKAAMMTNKAGQMTQAGENLFAKVWDPKTRTYEYKVQDVQGYDMTDLGAMLRPKVDTEGNIVYKSGKAGFGEDRSQNDTMLFPKNAANDLGGNQYMFAPPELGGRGEWLVRQNKETGEYEFMGTKEQLRLDPKLQAEVGLQGQEHKNPLIQAANALGLRDNLTGIFADVNQEAMRNPALNKAIQNEDVVGSTLEYGKTKAGQVLNSKKVTDLKNAGMKLAKSLGIDPRSFLGGQGSGGGGIAGMFGLSGLQNKVNDLQKQFTVKQQRDQAEAAERARQESEALRASIAQAQANLPRPVQAPMRQAPQFAPQYGTVGNIQQAIASDPFSKKGIGTNSLYRL